MQALSNALTQGRLHHAYLLTGTRGVGKTTLARILAKCLNCETGVTATPCGTCSACTQIDAGRFVDLLELDAASNTGVDNMREVLDNAQYAPTVGRYKVYIIDEVHMLSKPAFNSMLKTLEEPPAHVKFILATTDPQKIPVTVLSRCLQFNLKPMPPALVAQHLGEVLEQENVACEPAALNLLARAAAGSMRDALSLTDQAIAYGGGKVEAAAVEAMLGTVRRDYLFDLLDALAAHDGDALLEQARQLAERGIAFDATLQDLGNLLTQLALLLHAPASGAWKQRRRRADAGCRRAAGCRNRAAVLPDRTERPPRPAVCAGRVFRFLHDAAAHAGLCAGFAGTRRAAWRAARIARCRRVQNRHRVPPRRWRAPSAPPAAACRPLRRVPRLRLPSRSRPPCIEPAPSAAPLRRPRTCAACRLGLARRRRRAAPRRHGQDARRSLRTGVADGRRGDAARRRSAQASARSRLSGQAGRRRCATSTARRSRSRSRSAPPPSRRRSRCARASRKRARPRPWPPSNRIHSCVSWSTSLAARSTPTSIQPLGEST